MHLLLSIGGNDRRVCPQHVGLLEGQLQILEAALKNEGIDLAGWLEKFEGNYSPTQVLLKGMGLAGLSTDIGIAFLKSKCPCPMENDRAQ